MASQVLVKLAQQGLRAGHKLHRADPAPSERCLVFRPAAAQCRSPNPEGIATLGCVLVTARKFGELKASPEGGTIEAPQPVDVLPRVVQAPELVARETGPSLDRIARIG